MTPDARGEGTPGDGLVIGSRRSRLARVQAEWVGARLAELWPGLSIAYRTFSTAGDRDPTTPLPRIGAKGLFTADLERALRDGEIDLAVHSLKDLPAEPSPGLSLVAVPRRADPRDVIVVRDAAFAGPDAVERLPAEARVGTSSLRRAAQVRARNPRLRVVPVRGNVETRLSRLETGAVEALVLAAAGLVRLGLRPPGAAALAPAIWLPAPGQGALAVQGRAEDPRVRELAGAADDAETRATTTAERALLQRLEGGCQVPIGALATIAGGRLRLGAAVYASDGTVPPVEGSEEGAVSEAAGVGERLADRLLAAGAGELVRRARADSGLD